MGFFPDDWVFDPPESKLQSFAARVVEMAATEQHMIPAGRA